MINMGRIWIGFNDTGCVSDIEHLARLDQELFESYGWALLSCLDSHRPPTTPFICAEIPPGILVSQVSGGLILSAAGLIDLAVIRAFFNGFDEVWFLSELPESDIPLPPALVTNAPDQYGIEHFAEVANWMEEHGAEFGIADGVGLNFASADERIALRLEKLAPCH